MIVFGVLLVLWVIVYLVFCILLMSLLLLIMRIVVGVGMIFVISCMVVCGLVIILEGLMCRFRLFRCLVIEVLVCEVLFVM